MRRRQNRGPESCVLLSLSRSGPGLFLSFSGYCSDVSEASGCSCGIPAVSTLYGHGLLHDYLVFATVRVLEIGYLVAELRCTPTFDLSYVVLWKPSPKMVQSAAVGVKGIRLSRKRVRLS